jgi:Nif-specific regulatory protein
LEWDGKMEVPASARSVVHEKLGRLSQSAIRVLKVILAVGGQIETELWADWLEPGKLYAALQELTGRNLIEPAGGLSRLSVGKESLEQALRPKMDQGEMEDISLQMAGMLEKRVRGPSDYYRLGLLYLQGGRQDSAFRYLSEAGDRFARFSIRDALLAYRKAIACGVEPDLVASVSEKIGDLKLEQGDLDSAAKHFEMAASARPSSLRKLGWVVGLKGEFEKSVEIMKQCEQSALGGGDPIEAARARSDLGYIYALQSKRDQGLEVLKQARRVFEENNMYLEAGVASNRIAFMEWKVGDFTGAAAAWVAARKCFERAGDKRRAAICLMSLGLCRRKEMNFLEGERCFQDALAIFTDIKAMGEKASCQQNYALLLLDQGHLNRATGLTRQALAAGTLLGWHSTIVTCTILLAALSLEAGDWQNCETGLSSLLEGDAALDTFQKAMIKRYLALASRMKGRLDQADLLADQSYEFAGQAQDAEGRGQAMLAKSTILLEMGEYARAAEAAREALNTLISSSSMLLANEARRIAGEALCRMGEPEAGTSMLLMAKQGFEEVPQSLHMARALRALALASFMEGDYDLSKSYLRKSADISRSAGARYDYADALLLGGKHALERGNLLRARHYLLEAARIFSALKIEGKYEMAVNEMEKVPSGDLEVKAVTSLSKISQTLNSSHDLTTVLNRAMDLAIEYLGAERGVIMLEDDGTGELATFAERAMDQESLEDVMSISRSIVESVRNTKESVIAGDATSDPRFKHSRSVKTHNIMSVMCVPLTTEEKFLGIIYVDSRDVSSGFSRMEKAFVEAFANQVSLAIVNARLVGRLYDDVADLRVQAAERYSFQNVIGPGKKMQEVFRKVDKAARSDLRILITGENGTGKQVIANLVHRLSDRSSKQMIQVNCAGIAKDLLESELFGIEKGVATGVSPRSGFFERADGSTIFLDEIGDMPPATQMRVLRVLSEREFERVGGSKIIRVNVRVISATNKNLRELVDQGLFRKDLYYRLNGMRIHIPPLRERKEDLQLLIDHFLAMYMETNQKSDLVMSREARALLMQYWWPGNVRELETCIQHSVIKADGKEILPEHLHDEVLDNLRSQDPSLQLDGGDNSLPDAVSGLERRMIERALRQSGWVKTLAAERLGIHEATLRKKMKKLGISCDRPRKGK